MILVRRKYEAEQTNYFTHLHQTYGKIPQNDAKAIKLRMNFFKQYVLERNPTDYMTNVQKDWAYNARKEYKSDVNVRASADAFAIGTCAMMFRMFMLKKFVFWPFFPAATVIFLYRQHQLFTFFSKKYFDMLNLGEQYEVGYARNRVLEKCNELLDRQDF